MDADEKAAEEEPRVGRDLRLLGRSSDAKSKKATKRKSREVVRSRTRAVTTRTKPSPTKGAKAAQGKPLVIITVNLGGGRLPIDAPDICT